jgi:3-methyladenine DNA glycosylase AlkD
MSSLNEVRRQLHAAGSPTRAASSARFFKTGPGQYGAGDVFIGVSVPQQRAIARSAKDLPLPDIAALLASKVHEERLLACILLAGRGQRAAKSGDDAETKKLAAFYWKHRAGINNWDLVDSSAEHVLGPYYFKRSRAPLFKMARSKRLWDRRYAVLTTFHFIRQGDFKDTLRLAELLMEDMHDLIHKACGWMLREVGKREPELLRAFLDENAARMPRTMLRYALEKLAPRERQHYMKKPSPSA